MSRLGLCWALGYACRLVSQGACALKKKESLPAGAREALSVGIIPNVIVSFSSAACFYVLSFRGHFLFVSSRGLQIIIFVSFRSLLLSKEQLKRTKSLHFPFTKNIYSDMFVPKQGPLSLSHCQSLGSIALLRAYGICRYSLPSAPCIVLRDDRHA